MLAIELHFYVHEMSADMRQIDALAFVFEVDVLTTGNSKDRKWNIQSRLRETSMIYSERPPRIQSATTKRIYVKSVRKPKNSIGARLVYEVIAYVL